MTIMEVEDISRQSSWLQSTRMENLADITETQVTLFDQNNLWFFLFVCMSVWTNSYLLLIETWIYRWLIGIVVRDCWWK